MKAYFKIFGIIVITAIIGFTFIACGDEDDGPPGSLEGSWYSSAWKETFTFDVDAKTFTKIQDDGAGERGTFTFTSSMFIYTITERTDPDDYDKWLPPEQSKQTVWPKKYIISGNIMIMDGVHTYIKIN